MQLPTISQYAGSIADPRGLTKTLGDFSAELDNYGEVKIRTGNNACVFHITRADRRFMLKCFIRPRNDLKEIYRYISSREDSLFPEISLLEDELYVFDYLGSGAFYDVVCSEWIEGSTLDTEIRRACREGNAEKLERLSRSFDILAYELLSREWAHGDLKPENIVVRPDGSLSLIDFDAIYFPENPAPSRTEVGTPGYQHPARDENIYDKCVDDYPLALISASLRALASEPSLYGKYSRSDILLINPAGVATGECDAYASVKRVLAAAGCTSHYKLALMLVSAGPRIDGLGDVFRRIVDAPATEGNLHVFNERGRFGYRYGNDGPVAVDAVFDEALAFRDGLAVVTWEGKRRVLSASGRFLLEDMVYDDIKPFSERLAAVCINGRWGYVSPEGEIAVEPVYEAAGTMHGGYAPVRSDGLWGYIDRNGVPATGFVYGKAFGLRNGVGEVWKDGKVTYIDFKDNNIGCK